MENLEAIIVGICIIKSSKLFPSAKVDHFPPDKMTNSKFISSLYCCCLPYNICMSWAVEKKGAYADMLRAAHCTLAYSYS